METTQELRKRGRPRGRIARCTMAVNLELAKAQRIRALAIARDCSESQVLREAVDLLLKQQEARHD